MKKVALSLMALAVVAAGAFADAPKWDPKVSTEFKGEATVTLGYDLDTGISAFKNGTSVSLIVDLVSGGDKATVSDKDVWGEIKIKTDGDPYRIKADGVATDGKATFEQGFKLQVDFAKIHFGKAAYLSVTSHSTEIAYATSPDLAFAGHVVTNYDVDTAAATAKGVRYGKVGDQVISKVASQADATAGGIEFGYSLEKVASVTVDVGTTDAWSTALVDANKKTNVAYKAAVALLAVDNLTLEGGYSAQTLKDSAKAFGAKTAYTYKIDGDKLYVKPSVGFTALTPAGKSAKAYNVAHASALLGTGAKAAQFDNYGLKLDSDWGAYPGVSAGVTYSDFNVVNKIGEKKAALGLNVSANSGALIADTTVVAALDINDLNAKDAAQLTVITIGASTSVKSGDITFAPKGLIVAESSKKGFVGKDGDLTTKATDSALFAKAAADITGVIPFVTFTVAYESNDLSNGLLLGPTANTPLIRDNKLVADKFGKVELTTKISF